MDWSWLFDFFDWWTAGRAGVAVGGAGAAAAIAAARSASKTFKQARTDSQARSRPMVAARFDKPPYTRGVADLLIQNYGPSIARNVRVTFDPELQDTGTKSGQPSMVPFLLERYKKPIGVLVPGVELRNVYWASRGVAVDGKYDNDEPTPDEITVTIEYEDDDHRPYVDSFDLDMRALVKLQTLVESSSSPESMAKEALKQLKIIAGAVRDAQKGNS